MSDVTSEPVAVSCPACGGENSADAIFCNACHKALGPFRYVGEEVSAATSRYEKLADRVTHFVSRPQFFVAHLLWIGLWIVANTGVLVVVRQFDEYPYSLLGILLGVEAILITGFLLFSQNRQQAQADTFAELEYEVNVRSYREMQAVKDMLQDIAARLDTLETAVQKRNREENSHE
jgi:uncharacterized membrane protein